MIAIAAVDDNWGIGYDNELLYRLPEDMKHFKKLTTDNIVVVGKNTYNSIGPLPNRINVVLSREEQTFEYDNVIFSTIDTLGEKLEELKKIYPEAKVYLIGGEKAYYNLIDYCDTAIITHIHSDKHANRFFPNLNRRKNWKFENSTFSEVSSKDNLVYDIITYNQNEDSVKALWP